MNTLLVNANKVNFFKDMHVKIDTDVNTGYGKDTDKNGYANIKYRELIQKLTATLSLTLLSFGWGSTVNAAQQQIALVGTWTSIPDAPLVQKPEKASEGLYQLQVNADGTLTPVKVLKMKSPSWVVKSKDGRFAYTTNEENEGAVTALSVQNGKVEVLNTVNSHGGHPTHASISLDGKFLFVSNYSAFDKVVVSLFCQFYQMVIWVKWYKILFLRRVLVMLKGVRIVAMPIRQLLAQMVSIYMQVILEMTKSMLFVTTQASLNHLKRTRAEM